MQELKIPSILECEWASCPILQKSLLPLNFFGGDVLSNKKRLLHSPKLWNAHYFTDKTLYHSYLRVQLEEFCPSSGLSFDNFGSVQRKRNVAEWAAKGPLLLSASKPQSLSPCAEGPALSRTPLSVAAADVVLGLSIWKSGIRNSRRMSERQ